LVKQIVVLGLGQFGMALARALAGRGVEVIAVDRRADRVNEAAEFCADAVRIDATEEDQIARLAPARRDVCVCAIGDENREASIVATALLKQLGAPRIIARATDPLHERILTAVGAHEVVNPERSYGERFAARLAQRGALDEVPIGDGVVLTEVVAPEVLVGHTLAAIGLPKRFRLVVVAIRRGREGSAQQTVLPSGDLRLEAGDVLLVVGAPGAAATMSERL
jgi:trk system potassium uptake protein TrkA